MSSPNIIDRLYIPVLEGLWKQKELWDGTYTYFDFEDILEALFTRRENEIRSREGRGNA